MLYFFCSEWLFCILLNSAIYPLLVEGAQETTVVVLCGETSARWELSGRLHEHKALPYCTCQARS